jgi:hypothetical protein
MKAAVVVVSWLVVLTVWTGVLTLWQLKVDLQQSGPGLFARWESQGLRVAGVDGRWMVTHLENLENRSIAKLPEPVWVVESGGVLLTPTDLAKLKWEVPAGPFDDVFTSTIQPAPGAGAKIEALYFEASRGKFMQRD